MYPSDVEALFPLIPVGTPVRLINDPVKVAWIDGELFLEADPPVDAQGQSFEPEIDQDIPNQTVRARPTRIMRVLPRWPPRLPIFPRGIVSTLSTMICDT
jgi:hypothetical protein